MLDRGLQQAFHPKSIAIVGISRAEGKSPPGYTGLQFLRLLREANYEGRIYPVNAKADTIAGLKAYPNVQSIPEHVDYVIVTVPAAAVPTVLQDCVTAGALDVLVCTAGFGETGEEEGTRLDSVMHDIAIKGGLRLVGPNSLGYHVPSARMIMYAEAASTPGPVAFISQSGGLCQMYTMQGPAQGIAFSKVISYGNALVMDSTDFLEYLATDQETGIICMYTEGVRDGAKLQRLVTQLVPSKPVVIWKAGLTPLGSRAAATHTGSMAGDKQVWDSFFNQTGAIRVNSIAEMIDVTMTFLRLKPLTRARVAMWGGGGGFTVTAGDVCTEEGLELPVFSEQTRSKLMEFMQLVNQIIVNPIDGASAFFDAAILRRGLETIAADPNIDIVLMYLPAALTKRKWAREAERTREVVSDLSHHPPSGKQVVVAIRDEGKFGDVDAFIRYLREADITTYHSLPRACRALTRFAGYHKFIDQTATGT
ncbi:CoA-binding protein [Chloroflexota bacterium]